MLSYIPCIYSLSFNVVIYIFWFLKFISEGLIWSYYFSYKCIKFFNDMEISYNNLSFFQTFSKPKMFDFFCIKHIIFCKKNFCMILFLGPFFFFLFQVGVMENLVEFYKKIQKLVTFLLLKRAQYERNF
jgi:hypothetical protein